MSPVLLLELFEFSTWVGSPGNSDTARLHHAQRISLLHITTIEYSRRLGPNVRRWRGDWQECVAGKQEIMSGLSHFDLLLATCKSSFIATILSLLIIVGSYHDLPFLHLVPAPRIHLSFRMHKAMAIFPHSGFETWPTWRVACSAGTDGQDREAISSSSSPPPDCTPLYEAIETSSPRIRSYVPLLPSHLFHALIALNPIGPTVPLGYWQRRA